MLKIYGSMLCGDCVECRKDLDGKGVSYTFCDFSEKLEYLKDFLKLREDLPIFEPLKQEGKIGIPCIVKEDGTITLSWEDFL